MSLIGNVVNPVVDRTWRKRQSWRHARSSLFWCAVNFLLTCAMYYELKFNTVGLYFKVSHSLLWYAESIFAVVFLINTVTNFFVYIKPYLSSKPVELTAAQKRLLAVKDTGKSKSSIY